MKKVIALIFVCLFGINRLFAQDEKLHIFFQPSFNASSLQLEQAEPYRLSNGDSIYIDELKFYISSIAFYLNDKTVWKENNSFHLLDVSEPGTLNISLNIPPGLVYDKIKFNVGIDSITNVSGAMGGDLDPVKGMYWTWQSGYINFKLEGRSQRCTARKHIFRFHLGGYEGDANSLQQITLAAPQGNIHISVSIDSFLSSIDLSGESEVMIPGAKAVALSKKLATVFNTTP